MNICRWHLSTAFVTNKRKTESRLSDRSAAYPTFEPTSKISLIIDITCRVGIVAAGSCPNQTFRSIVSRSHRWTVASVASCLWLEPWIETPLVFYPLVVAQLLQFRSKKRADRKRCAQYNETMIQSLLKRASSTKDGQRCTSFTSNRRRDTCTYLYLPTSQ
ncbi:uncharacterized protein YALI1_E28855g [Yarrowia lipolytica]|uniref:Uncharacterized protein n=1 Tax=Yarrowia lipolytica TaxID=4952 RepID=A0A1D8NJT9_YARLL|nr:hypothetical protein YALI1_E28855g [Yarrowia lipolytica]